MPCHRDEGNRERSEAAADEIGEAGGDIMKTSAYSVLSRAATAIIFIIYHIFIAWP